MLEKNVYNLIFYYISGEALFAKLSFHEAEFWYKKSLESKPDHLPALLALAKLLSNFPGRIKEAEDLYKKAFEVKRDSAEVYIQYGKYSLIIQLKAGLSGGSQP